MSRRLDETQFPGLHIWQDPEMFCFGTDAVLLSGFTARLVQRMKGRKMVRNLVDLGCGNGIMPVLLARETEIPRITGVEMLPRACELARESVEMNGLSDRIRILRADIACVLDPRKEKGGMQGVSGADQTVFDADQTIFDADPRVFDADRIRSMFNTCDMVISNPPYMKQGHGRQNALPERLAARQETTADLEAFLKLGGKLLRSGGSFCMVHRANRMADILSISRALRLEPKLLRLVSGRRGEEPKLLLLQMVKDGGAELRVLPEMAIREADGSFSEEMLSYYYGCRTEGNVLKFL